MIEGHIAAALELRTTPAYQRMLAVAKNRVVSTCTVHVALVAVASSCGCAPSSHIVTISQLFTAEWPTKAHIYPAAHVKVPRVEHIVLVVLLVRF